MIEGWQGWREGGNPAVTHSSRRGGAPTTHKKTSVIFPRIFMYLHNSILMYYMTCLMYYMTWSM